MYLLKLGSICLNTGRTNILGKKNVMEIKNLKKCVVQLLLQGRLGKFLSPETWWVEVVLLPPFNNLVFNPHNFWQEPSINRTWFRRKIKINVCKSYEIRKETLILGEKKNYGIQWNLSNKRWLINSLPMTSIEV